MLSEIPVSAPETPLLESIDGGASLREMDIEQLQLLAEELRAYLLYSVGQSGGHFRCRPGGRRTHRGPSPCLRHFRRDRVVWDVGHQTYPHKILTGRMQRMHHHAPRRRPLGVPQTQRERVRHLRRWATPLPASPPPWAWRWPAAPTRRRSQGRIAVIGDGAITGGMAFEALAHAGHERPDMLVILNDNQMSIGHNTRRTGHLFRQNLGQQVLYLACARAPRSLLEKMRHRRGRLPSAPRKHMKGMVAPGTLFEELGFHYIGPMDGHDLPAAGADAGEHEQTAGGPATSCTSAP